MKVYEASINRRTIRKFKQKPIPEELLIKMVNAARLSPTGANMQPLKYIVVTNKEKCAQIFPHTKYAGYLQGKGSPSEAEQPAAYILVMGDNGIKTNVDTDEGAAIQSILLTAYDDGIASCWLGAIERDKIKELLNIGEQFQLHSIVALGYAAQESVSEDMPGDDVKYYLDDNGVLHVPKRKISDIAQFIK